MREITLRESYEAMFAFLQNYYDQTKADGIGALLGEMCLLEDGRPADSAIWNDWISAVAKTISE